MPKHQPKPDEELIEDLIFHLSEGWSIELSSKKAGLTYGSVRKRALKNEDLRQLILRHAKVPTSIYKKEVQEKEVYSQSHF